MIPCDKFEEILRDAVATLFWICVIFTENWSKELFCIYTVRKIYVGQQWTMQHVIEHSRDLFANQISSIINVFVLLLRFPVTLHILQEQFSFWTVTTTLKDIFFTVFTFVILKTLRYLCYRDGHISRYGYSSVNSSFNTHLFFRASVMRLTLFWQNRGHMMNPCFWSVTVKMKVWCFFIPSCMCLK